MTTADVIVIALLVWIIYRLETRMPSMEDLNNVLGALENAITEGFASLAQTVQEETEEVLDALSALNVGQEVIDRVEAMRANLVAAFAAAQADVADTVTLPPAQFVLHGPQSAIAVGGTFQATVELINSVGIPKWFSDAPDIASVSSDGAITGVAPGTTKIYARIRGTQAFVEVTVE